MRVTSALAEGLSKERNLGRGPEAMSAIMSGSAPQDWSAVLQQSIAQVSQRSQKHAGVSEQIAQMGDLLKIQADIGRYQLKVELVSKVSEGAVSTVRKLQQNQ